MLYKVLPPEGQLQVGRKQDTSGHAHSAGRPRCGSEILAPKMIKVKNRTVFIKTGQWTQDARCVQSWTVVCFNFSRVLTFAIVDFKLVPFSVRYKLHQGRRSAFWSFNSRNCSNIASNWRCVVCSIVQLCSLWEESSYFVQFSDVTNNKKSLTQNREILWYFLHDTHELRNTFRLKGRKEPLFSFFSKNS